MKGLVETGCHYRRPPLNSDSRCSPEAFVCNSGVGSCAEVLLPPCPYRLGVLGVVAVRIEP
jgi:hypothetical protein